MKILFSLFDNSITEAFGWFLVHSVWQGTLVALVLALILAVLRNKAARLRYYLAYFAMMIMIAGSAYTFLKALEYAQEKQQLKSVLVENPEALKHYLAQANTERAAEQKGVNSQRIRIKTLIQRNFPLIVGLWCAGVIAYLIWIIFSFFYQSHMLKKSRVNTADSWLVVLEALSKRLKLHKSVRLFGSSNIQTPLTSGFLKPVILVPLSLFSELSVSHLEAILAHELAHIKRHDYLLNLLQTLVETIFFFHPAVWYISAQIRKEREHACDDLAIEITSDPVNYAKALASAEAHRIVYAKLAMSFAPFRISLLERIKRLNKTITMKTNLTEKTVASLIVVAGLISLSFLIDGSYAIMKADEANIYNDADSTLAAPKPKKQIIVLDTQLDSSGNTITKKKVYTSTDPDVDSLVAMLEEHKILHKETEKIVELVMTEENHSISEEMIKNIQLALVELEAAGVEAAVLEARKVMENEELRIKLRDSLAVHMTEEEALATQKAVEEALSSAAEALESIDYEEIAIEAAVSAQTALENLDLELIISAAMEEAGRALENVHIELDELHEYDEEDMQEMEELHRYHQEEERISLEEKQAALEAELEALENELKEVKKQKREEKRGD